MLKRNKKNEGSLQFRFSLSCLKIKTSLKYLADLLTLISSYSVLSAQLFFL